MELVYRIGDIDDAAEKLWTGLPEGHVLSFTGEMGAGKTTFIHALCRYLQIKGTLSSPTFSIINEYASPEGPVYHIDLYRCKNTEEAVRAGVEDCLYSGRPCFVEWPSRAEEILPPHTIEVGISDVDSTTRRITVFQEPLTR